MLTIIYMPLKNRLLLIATIGLLLSGGFHLQAQSLDSLKLIAAENNLALKAQYKSFESQLEKVTQAQSWQDPNLSFGYFVSPIETRVGPQIARFSLSQMLPWFGTYKAKAEVATYQAEAEFEKFQDQKLKLFLQVANQYYELSAIRWKIQLENEQLKLLRDVKSIVEANYENNKANLVDVLRVDLEIDKQKTSIEVLEKQDQALVSQLNQLMNRSSQQPIKIANAQLVLEKNNNLEADFDPDTHPRLEIIKKQKASSEAKIELAQKQAMPKFGFGLDYAIIQDQNVMNADAGQDAFMPMLSLSLPIFGKKNKSRKQEAKLQSESLEFQLEDEQKRLETEMEVARYKQEELQRLLNLYDQQLANLQDIIMLSEMSLANAKMAVEEVLRLYEEQLLYKKQEAKTFADLQKIKEKINYLSSN